MLLEWNRWIEGMAAFKEGQGLLWVFTIVLFAVQWHRGILQKNKLLIGGCVLGLLTVFPLTAVVLLKGFTPFYNWLDLQQLFPLMLLTALLATEFVCVVEMIPKGKHLGIMCAAILLLAATGFHGFDRMEPADEHGVPVAYADAFESLEELVGERSLIIAANGDMLQYARLYEASWQPLYGRDLWSGKSASYINSGYDIEYDYYTLLEQAELKEEAYTEFVALVEAGAADCIIVPYYWREAFSQIPGYQLVALTESYNVIVKEDLIAK